MTPFVPLALVPARLVASRVQPGLLEPGGSSEECIAFALGDFEVCDGVVRVPLHGELDFAAAPRLYAGLAPLMELLPGTAAGAGPDTARATAGVSWRGTVAFEMSDLTFVDSAGLTALDAARTRLIIAGWRVCLTRPRRAVLRLLEFAIDAGWFPADSACADVGTWGRLTRTRMTLASWPDLQLPADRDARTGADGLLAARPSADVSAESGSHPGCGGQP